jgi:hypothetical protein
VQVDRRTARHQHAAGLVLEHALDRGQQATDRERLLDEVGGAQARRGDRVLDVAVAGDHDYADIRPLGLDAAQHFDAVDVGHPDVEQNERRVLARDQVHHAGGIAGVEHAKPFVAEDSTQR